ncbi:MAG: hypothetical protein E7374_01290 [Clostridiales bacterium]|nr:hypothetical protein [Clostridiales bacterium]
MSDIGELPGKKRQRSEFQHYTQFSNSFGIEKDEERRIYATFVGEKNVELLRGELYFVEKVLDYGFSADIILQGVDESNLHPEDFKFYRMINSQLVEWDIFLDREYSDSDEFTV